MKASAPNLPSDGDPASEVMNERPWSLNAGQASLVVDQAISARMASTIRPAASATPLKMAVRLGGRSRSRGAQSRRPPG